MLLLISTIEISNWLFFRIDAVIRMLFCNFAINMTKARNQEETQYDKKISTIENLRFPMAVLIVFLHSKNRVSFAETIQTDFSVFQYVEGFFSGTLASIAVPLFFFISGYLYFQHFTTWNWETYFRKSRRRIYTLLIPFILWNILKLSSLCIEAFPAYGLSGVTRVLNEYGGWRIFWDGNADMSAPILQSTWFLRDLIIFCLLTPVVYLLVKHAKSLPLIFLFFCNIFNVWPTEYICKASAFFPFLFGATFSILEKDIFNLFSSIRFSCYLLTGILALFLTVIKADSIVWFLYTTCGIIALLNLSSQFNEQMKRIIPIYCTQSSYFIYLGHSFLILSGFTWLFSQILPYNSEGWLIIRYFLSPIATVIFLVYLYIILRRYVPRVLFLLLGEKIIPSHRRE